MKINCNVIADLLELYSDGIVSADTRELVDSHLAECKDCSAKLKQIKGVLKLPAKVDSKPLRSIKIGIQKRFVVLASVSVLVIAALFIGFRFFPGDGSRAVDFDEFEILDVQISEDKLLVTVDRYWGGWGAYYVLDHDNQTYETHFRLLDWKDVDLVKIEPTELGIALAFSYGYDEYGIYDEENAIEYEIVKVYYCKGYYCDPHKGCLRPDDRHLVWER